MSYFTNVLDYFNIDVFLFLTNLFSVEFLFVLFLSEFPLIVINVITIIVPLQFLYVLYLTLNIRSFLDLRHLLLTFEEEDIVPSVVDNRIFHREAVDPIWYTPFDQDFLTDADSSVNPINFRTEIDYTDDQLVEMQRLRHLDSLASYKAIMQAHAAKRCKITCNKYRHDKYDYSDETILNDPELLNSDSAIATLLRNGAGDMAAKLRSLSSEAGDKRLKSIFKHVEDMVVIYYALKDAKNLAHFVSIMLLAIKSKCPDLSVYEIVTNTLFGGSDIASVVSSLMDGEEGPDYTDFTDFDCAMQSDAKVAEATPADPRWKKFISAFGTLTTGVSNTRSSTAMAKVTNVISILLALGFLSETKTLAVNVRGIDLFAFHAAKRKQTGFDLLDVVMDTGKFFCEQGYKCFKTGSIMPLFINCDDAIDLDKQYVDISANFQFVKIGEYTKSPWLDEQDFDLQISNLIVSFERLHAAVDPTMRPYISKRLENLKRMKAEFELVRTSGGLRAAPWSFLLHGTSSVAKSTVVNNLINFSLLTMARIEGKPNFRVDPNMICTLNDMDKYHSDYSSHIQAVLLDDLANAKANTVSTNPTVNIINFVNNVKRTAIMAEADLKGKIQLCPRVVAATTNVWADWAHAYSNEPLSALRRFQIHLRVRVKPDYLRRDTTMVSGAALAAQANKGVYCPDAWEFDAVEFIGANQGGSIGPQACVERPFQVMGHDGNMQDSLNIDFGQVMRLFKVEIEKHVITQKSVVETSEHTFKQGLCLHGEYRDWCANCHRLDPTDITSQFIEQMPVPTETPELKSDSKVSRPRKPMHTIDQDISEVPYFGWKDVDTGEMFDYEDEADDGEPPYTVDRQDAPENTSSLFATLTDCLPSLPTRMPGQSLYERLAMSTPLPPTPPPTRREMREEMREQVAAGVEDMARTQERSYIYRTRQAFKRWRADLHLWGRTSQKCDDMLTELDSLSARWFDPILFVPQYFFDKTSTQCCLVWSRCQTSIDKYRRVGKYFTALLSAVAWVTTPYIVLPGLGIYATTVVLALSARKRHLVNQISECREIMPKLFKSFRDSEASVARKLCALIGFFLMLYACYNVVRKLFGNPVQSDGNGVSISNTKTDVWRVPEVAPLPKGSNPTTCVDHLATRVAKSLAHVRIERAGLPDSMCNGLFLRSNVLLLPAHEGIYGDTVLHMDMIGPNCLSGKNFSKHITAADAHRVTHQGDLQMIYVGNTGDMPDITLDFPEEKTKRLETTRMLWKNDQTILKEWKTRITGFSDISTAQASIPKAPIYSLTSGGFAGLCMATHIAELRSGSYIAGFHLASDRKESGVNAMQSVTRSELNDSIREMIVAHPSMVLTTSSGTMPVKQYDIDFTPTPDIPLKSPARFIEKGHVNHYGAIPQFAVRPKSRVTPSPASETVEKYSGVPNTWVPPANCRKDETGVPSWHPYQAYLQDAAVATQEFPTDVLDKATRDFLCQVDRIIDSPHGKEQLKKVRVLTPVEACSGADDMEFAGPMKKQTSMGHPVRKVKDPYLTVLPEDEQTGFAEKRIIDEETLRIAAEQCDAYRQNKRAYPVFTACTKDEPVPLHKAGEINHKVRVFQSAPAALQYNIRKYFLAVCNFMSNCPLGMEAAVGVNADGPNWHELQAHITKYGIDHIIAGDFKKYDVNMSARMVLLSFKIMIYIAQRAGYSEDDLIIMNGLASDCASPIVNLNGELVQLYGSNPSGQNLTVYTNGIVNSLYTRCCFYTIYPDNYENTGGLFSDFVALSTYGDDNIMSVREDYPGFNHTAIQAVYAKQGITYTMADKTAKSVPYIHHKDSDFLKRKSRFDPSFQYTETDGTTHNGLYMAVLDEDSIFKSLHSNVRSKEQSEHAVAAQCIDNAAREFWFHGREKFDAQHIMLKKVVAECGYEDLVNTTFNHDYDTRRTSWMEKYNVQEAPYGPAES